MTKGRRIEFTDFQQWQEYVKDNMSKINRVLLTMRVELEAERGTIGEWNSLEDKGYIYELRSKERLEKDLVWM